MGGVMLHPRKCLVVVPGLFAAIGGSPAESVSFSIDTASLFELRMFAVFWKPAIAR